MSSPDKFFLQLSDEPIKFDPVSLLTNVFFDDTNSQVFTVRSGGLTGVTVHGLDQSVYTSFNMEDQTSVISIKFSPNKRILAIQTTQTSVEFRNFEDLKPTNIQYVHHCKWKNASILGFVWPKDNEIAFISDHGIELLQVIPEKKQLKSLKSTSFSGAWFSWCAPSKIVLLAGNNGLILQPYSLNNSSVTKLQKLELEAGKPACERDVTLLYVSKCTWCALLRHGPVATTPAKVSLLPVSGAPLDRRHSLDTGLVGRFAINVVDDLIIIHHQASKTSLLFDIMEECSLEDHIYTHEPIVRGKSMKPALVDGQSYNMYSVNWVMFQPDIIIDARLGYFWKVHFMTDALASVVPVSEYSRIVDVLLRRSNGKEAIYKILNDMVPVCRECLSELDKVFDRINGVYRKWGEVEIAKRMGHNVNHTSCTNHLANSFPVVITQQDIDTYVFQRNHEAQHIVQAITSYIRSLRSWDLTVEPSLAESMSTLFVLKGAWSRLCHMLPHLADSKQLACLLLSLGNIRPYAAQLALDMLHRLRAHDETVEVLLGWQEPVASLGVARQTGVWETTPARKMLEAAAKTEDQDTFIAVYHALENRNRIVRDSPNFLKGEQCEKYVQQYKQIMAD